MIDESFKDMVLAVQRMNDEIVAMQSTLRALRATIEQMRRQLQAKVNA